MFASLSLVWLLVIFAGAAAIVWLAGIWLSDSTDVLSSRLGLGQALGGIILLAIGTNLPEIAITASAALHHNLGVAIGNLLGGIAIQTVVLAVLDFAMKGDRPLTYRAASLTLVLEATIVVVMLAIAIMGTRLAPSLILFRVTPQNLALLFAWMAGVFVLQRTQGHLPWQGSGNAPAAQAEPAGHSQVQKSKQKVSTGVVAVRFVGAAVVTLAAGVALELSGDQIAHHLGMSGVLFGATVLAASTSIPEVSTGITSVRMGDYQLAISDIFGGNAFLPILFLLASVLSGQSVLPYAQNTDVYLASLGIVVTSIYIFGLILRPQRRIARMGLDSWLVLICYLVGIAGLFYVHNQS
jgi:cation:H+ antiporter